MLKRNSLVLAAVLCAVFISTACPQPCDFPVADLPLAVGDGQKVLRALEAFKSERGEYPDKLEALVPKYLETQPEKLGGHDFFYTRHGHTFGIYVRYEQKGRTETCELSNLENKLNQ